MTPFEIIDSISTNKKRLIDGSNEKEYTAWMVNRGLSYFPDTIMYAQEMNQNHGLDLLLQYDYYFHSLRPKKRFAKWNKKKEDADLAAIMEYYGYSHSKAKEAMSILSRDQIKQISEAITRGKEQ